jgi:hypothetical protein
MALTINYFERVSMNKKISLAAIAMFAVIMGMSAFAPAAMASPNSEHNPKNPVCHFDRDTADDGDTTTDDRAWIVKMVNKHAEVAHLGHGDIPIGGVTDLPNTITADDCAVNQVLPDPDL